MRLNHKGFTLIELIITVAVAAILLGVAVPGYQTMVTQNKARTVATEFMQAIDFARSEALKQGAPVIMCARGQNDTCSDNVTAWQFGWLVFGNVGISRVAGNLRVDTTNSPLLLQRTGEIDEESVFICQAPCEAGVANSCQRPCQVRRRARPPRFILFDAQGFVQTDVLTYQFRPPDCPTGSQHIRNIQILPSGRTLRSRVAC